MGFRKAVIGSQSSVNAYCDYDDYCRENVELATELVALASRVTGGRDTSHLWETFIGVANVQDVMRIFRREGIRWGQLVEHDTVQILSGNSTRHFLSKWQWAEVYRAHRGIPAPQRQARALGASDAIELLREQKARWAQQREQYGVTAHLTEHGYACYKEQQYFYGTQEWKDRVQAARLVAGHRCWRCGTQNMVLHVHHHSPIVSAYHVNFSINFDDCRLEVLCADCHERFHSRVVRGDLSYCFVYAAPETVAQYKGELRKLDELHNIVYNCPFCQNRIAEMYPNT